MTHASRATCADLVASIREINSIETIVPKIGMAHISAWANGLPPASPQLSRSAGTYSRAASIPPSLLATKKPMMINPAMMATPCMKSVIASAIKPLIVV